MTIRKLLNRCFKLEEINGRNVCPTYLYRWTLLRLCGIGVYLHNFVDEDWSRDMHDHPKRFISIGLAGGYVEETPKGERTYRSPWVRSFPADHLHRLRLINGRPCWTLVIVLRAKREWGFVHGGRWIHWRTYVGSQAATDRKACP